jgi:Flp pilus assembly protein TadG
MSGWPCLPRGHDDRGAIAPLIAVVAMALFLMVGLAVDGGGRMRAIERADDLAAEAARTGGQVLNLPDAVRGRRDVIDPAAARRAALAYLDDAGVTGTATVSGDGKTITVTTRIKYRPVLLSLIGLGPWTQTGSATSTLITR